MLFREHENNPKNYQNGYGEAQFNSISLQETNIIERIKRKINTSHIDDKGKDCTLAAKIEYL